MTTGTPSKIPATEKIATGIPGFDQMTAGGLPRGRITAIIGTTGAGKTVFAMQAMLSLVGASKAPGVFVSFEQAPETVVSDFASFGWDATALVEAGKLHIVDARPAVDMVLSGAFDLDGLLAAVGSLSGGAPLSCVVFDGIDALLGLLPTPAAQRQELLRIQDRGARLAATTLLTVKAGFSVNSSFEDLALYMADCVIELSRDTEDGVSNRSIRIQKYRGSSHVLSRQPFLLTAQGFEVEGFDSRPLVYPAMGERLSTGLPRLDSMLGGGFFRGSSTLLSGAPGTAKTTIGALFLSAMCARGEPALLVGFDETPQETLRNMASVGIDLAPHVASGRLHIHRIANRSAGPDEISYEITSLIEKLGPRHLLIDPISVFSLTPRAQNAVYRISQLCKRHGITILFTSLLDRASGELEATRSHISALSDTWIHLSYVISGGERNRALTIVKSRGTAHSNQVAELVLSSAGLSIADVYTEDGAVLMGSLRWQRERANNAALRKAAEEATEHYRQVEHSADEIGARITTLTHELDGKRRELERLRNEAVLVAQEEGERRNEMTRLRGGEAAAVAPAVR